MVRLSTTAPRLAGVALGVLLPVATHATTFPWKSEFTDASSKEMAALHEAIHAPHAEGLRAHAVTDLVWTEKDFKLEMKSGTLYLEPPIDGLSVGAFFEGSAVVHFTPSDATARTSMQRHLSKDRLEGVPVTTAYVFSIRPDSPLVPMASSARATSAPKSLDVYEADKSALRQLGLDLTASFLNREGSARGATYVLFPIEEIRRSGSEQARLLYSFDPTWQNTVRLRVFGHEEMVDVKPYKFRFYPLASYNAANDAKTDDLSRCTNEISLGRSANSANEKATLEIAPAAGSRAIRLDYTITMEVSGVTLAGAPIPFLQWKDLNNDPDFDETLLFLLSQPSDGKPLNAIIESSGLLFEPWLGSFVLLDEDNWYPNNGSHDEKLHELRLTIPKNLVGIGVGERVSDDVVGMTRTIVFRSTQPTKGSTFYYGDYTMTSGQADDLTVELYQERGNIQEQKNAKFTLTEITNAVKVYNRMFGPLDIKSLRVASTRTSHGRGFEGLLLLGAGGSAVSSQSWADLFRAHEVAHQWWGHYVRPLRWPQDRWLSEAFAEYSAMEYYKIRFNDHRKAIEVMTEHWLQPLTDGTVKHETLTGEKTVVMGGTTQPIRAGTDNVYTKGPLVLHMLRYMFTIQKNDEAFFAILKDFVQQDPYKQASTEDFRKVAEKHIGSDLGWFFNQWIEDGGLPVLKWNHTVTPDGDKFLLTVNGRQEQKAYRLIVPVYMRFPGDKMVVRPWLIEGEKGTFNVKLPAKPEQVSLNDNLESLLILKPLREGT